MQEVCDSEGVENIAGKWVQYFMRSLAFVMVSMKRIIDVPNLTQESMDKKAVVVQLFPT